LYEDAISRLQERLKNSILSDDIELLHYDIFWADLLLRTSMKIEGVNPETGEKFEAEVSNLDQSFIEKMAEMDLPDVKIKRMIENLDIPADAKVLLYSISKTTIKAGQYIVKIGRKIIDFVCQLYKDYPSSTFSMIFGGLLGILLSTIPILGVLLGPMVTAFLAVIGYIQDIKDKELNRKIVEISAKFTQLNPEG
jgi:hypothetical protein